MDIKKDLGENHIVVVVSHNKDYADQRTKLVKLITGDHRRICYVTLHKQYSEILSMLKANNISPDKFFFIDPITKTFRTPERTEHDIVINSRKVLNILDFALSNVLDSEKIDIVFFDFFTKLLVYEDSLLVMKFLHTIMSKIRACNIKGVFTGLKKDMPDAFLKDLSMFTDKIIDLSEEGKK